MGYYKIFWSGENWDWLCRREKQTNEKLHTLLTFWVFDVSFCIFPCCFSQQFMELLFLIAFLFNMHTKDNWWIKRPTKYSKETFADIRLRNVMYKVVTLVDQVSLILLMCTKGLFHVSHMEQTWVIPCFYTFLFVSIAKYGLLKMVFLGYLVSEDVLATGRNWVFWIQTLLRCSACKAEIHQKPKLWVGCYS